MRDDKGIYDEALLKAIGYLARTFEAPIGGSFNELGRSVRYIPLFVTLYLVSITCTEKKNDRLLKKVFELELQPRTRYDEGYPITYVLFLIRRGADFFQPLHDGYPKNKWCDPIATYAKPLLEKILLVDGPLWDSEAAFYKGEYILCLAPIDTVDKTTGKPMVGHPSSGLYIFLTDAVPIIARFLKQDRDWIQKLFKRPLKEILQQFDKTAAQLATGGCWANGFAANSLQTAFPEASSSERTQG